MVKVCAFVAEFCYVAEYQEAVGKAFGNVELFFILFRKLYAIPFSVSFAVGAEIYRHIENFSFDHPDQFPLRELFLVMKSS